MDLLLVVGGYNSSNTSHLAEMGEAKLPTYFIRNASRLESRDRIVHYDLHAETRDRDAKAGCPSAPLTVGITAGASCPNNLIEETILRLFELHGVIPEQLLAHRRGRETARVLQHWSLRWRNKSLSITTPAPPNSTTTAR